MVKGGFVLNLVGIVLVTVFTLLAAMVFDIPLTRGVGEGAADAAAQAAP
jgi:hypothetical protein